MKGKPLRTRLIVLFAAVALMMAGAVPAIAGPGGVPGPPPGHEKNKDDVVVDDDVVVEDEEEEKNGPPEWANAYGKRIKDEYGITYGHLQQCAGLDEEPVVDEGEPIPSTELDDCPEDLEFPEDANGAKAFWLFTEAGMLIVGI